MEIGLISVCIGSARAGDAQRGANLPSGAETAANGQTRPGAVRCRQEHPGTSQLGSVGNPELPGEGWERGSGALGSEGLFVLEAAAAPEEITDVHRDWASSPSLAVGTASPGLCLPRGSRGPFCPLRTAPALHRLRVSGVPDLGFPFPSYPGLTPQLGQHLTEMIWNSCGWSRPRWELCQNPAAQLKLHLKFLNRKHRERIPSGSFWDFCSSPALRTEFVRGALG